MELTREQKLAFHEAGYLKLEGVIPQPMVASALQAINHEMGKEQRQRFEEINQAPVITDLFNQTPAFSLVESAMGNENLQRLGAGTIKLQYPVPVGTPARAPGAWLATSRPTLADGRTPGRDCAGPRFYLETGAEKWIQSQF